MRTSRTILLGLMLTISLPALRSQVLYVRQGATGLQNGSSWEHAFADLQEALFAALPGDEIWVAAGLYRPGAAGDDPEATFFSLIDGVALLGGFAGHETQPEERSWQLHPTILSGDLLGDDQPGDFYNFRSDNCWRVVQASEEVGPNSLIDGFFIEGGHSESKFGGGLFCLGRPTIKRCHFRQNHALTGGGLALKDLQGMLVEDCRFTHNRALRTGGGLLLTYCSEVEIRNCEFTDNQANWGGGIDAYSSSYTLSSSRFLHNTAMPGGGFEPDGGAIANREYEAEPQFVRILDCHFENNQAADFGGAIINVWTHFEIDGCTFVNNQALQRGGGAIAGGYNTGTIEYSVFAGNTAAFGGAISLSEGDYEVSTSLFHHNRGELLGGVFFFNETNLRLTNLTVADNDAPQGYGLFHGGDKPSTLTVQNTLWHNPGGPDFAGQLPAVEIASLGGNLCSDDSGENLFQHPKDLHRTDPLLTSDQQYRLSSTSPCVNAGVPLSSTPLLDLDGNLRVQGEQIDIGAFESPFFTGVQEAAAGEYAAGWLVYPNPTAQELTVELDDRWEGDLLIGLYDLSGRALLRFPLEKTENVASYTLDLGRFPPGHYLVQLSDGRNAIGQLVQKR